MRSLALVLALLWVTAGRPAGASSVVSESVEELAQAAPVVVRATVGQSQSAWETGGRRIWTWTELRITEGLKGEVGKTVLVKQPGGEVGPVGQAVEGVARFTLGEDVVLFLEPAPDEPGVFVVRALAAGKVVLRPQGGQAQAVRELDGLQLVQRGTVRPVTPEATLGTAEGFLTRVRRAVKGVAR